MPARHYINDNHVYATYHDASFTRVTWSVNENNNLSCIQLDITDYQSVNELPSKLDSIDILINNAGYYGPKGYGLGNTDVEEVASRFRNQHHRSSQAGLNPYCLCLQKPSKRITAF